MQFFRCLKALKGSLRLPLGIQAQQIDGVVAEKKGKDVYCPRGLFRNFEALRYINLFVAALSGLLQADDTDQIPLLREIQRIGDLSGAVSLLREFSLLGHIFIVFDERLQDHRITSLPPTSITPLFITARKKVG